MTDDIPPWHAAAMQQIGALHAQRQTLEDAQVEAETEFVERIACDYAAGDFADRDAHALYRQLRTVGMPGFRKRWDAVMPPALHSSKLLWPAILAAPDDDGIWRGEFPLNASTRTPTTATSVVYVLYDAENNPCYVGSSGRFRARLKRHGLSGKAFTRWMAYPCADREAAYRLEEKLLLEHKPYLNRRVGR